MDDWMLRTHRCRCAGCGTRYVLRDREDKSGLRLPCPSCGTMLELRVSLSSVIEPWELETYFARHGG